MKESIDQLHSRLILIMKEIHRICEENHLRYSLAGGSLIGAMRHQGFIPWDDDMDVMMPYTDFVKFKEVVFAMNHPWLEFKTAENSINYYRTIFRAMDKRTTLVEHDDDDPHGVFVDVFPFVFVGDSVYRAKIEFYYYRIFKALLMRKALVYKDKNPIKEFLLTQASKLVSVPFLCRQMGKQFNRLNKKRTKYSADLDGSLHGIVLSECFDGFEARMFESERFMTLKNADQYLTSVFGDYMCLPPKEKQVGHHMTYINVELPYEIYKRKSE